MINFFIIDLLLINISNEKLMTKKLPKSDETYMLVPV